MYNVHMYIQACYVLMLVHKSRVCCISVCLIAQSARAHPSRYWSCRRRRRCSELTTTRTNCWSASTCRSTTRVMRLVSRPAFTCNSSSLLQESLRKLYSPMVFDTQRGYRYECSLLYGIVSLVMHVHVHVHMISSVITTPQCTFQWQNKCKACRIYRFIPNLSFYYQ